MRIEDDEIVGLSDTVKSSVGDKIGSDISEGHFASVEGDMDTTAGILLASSWDVDVADISEGISGAGILGLVKSDKIIGDLVDGWLEISVDPGEDIQGLVVVAVVHVR